MQATAETTTYVPGTIVCRTISTHYQHLCRLAHDGYIRTREVPGGRRLFCLEDAKALATASTRGRGAEAPVGAA
jgi:hypothetical protein